jgi:hypothetical protein
MFVCDEDGVDAIRLLADKCQPLAKLAKTEARIHKYAGFFGGDERGVSRTSAR